MSKRAIINLVSSDEGDDDWHPTDDEAAASHGHLLPAPKAKSVSGASKQPPKKKQKAAKPMLTFTVGSQNVNAFLSQPSLPQPQIQAAAAAATLRKPICMAKIPERDSLSSSPVPPPFPAKAKAGPKPSTTSSHQDHLPWSEKHAPISMDALSASVQKKKVLEVRDWLEHQLPNFYKKEYCRLMILTGPSGCGKSSCVRVLAADLGFTVVEWVSPAPTVWMEQKYVEGGEVRGEWGGAGGGGGYLSKLDQFDEFVTRAKYRSLSLESLLQPTSSQGQSKEGYRGAGAGAGAGVKGGGSRPKLILIDDLPHASDLESRKRLSSSLQDLVRTSRCPVILISTDQGFSSSSSSWGGGGGGGGGNAMNGSFKGLHKEVMAALQSVGSMIVAFNPVTDANVAKVLSQVASKEGLILPSEGANAIASISGGDMRSALQSLQVLWQAQQREGASGSSLTISHGQGALGGLKGGTRATNGKVLTKKALAAANKALAAANKESASRSLLAPELEGIVSAQKDVSLQIFHALGKVLYNKRGAVVHEEEEGEEEEEHGGGWLRGGGGGGRLSTSSRPPPQPSAASRARSEAALLVKGKAREQGLLSSWASQWSQALSEAARSVHLPPYLSRPPMRYDPESLLVQSGLDPSGALGFLHENFLQFVDEAAMEDVSEASSYLSEASLLLSASGSRGGGGGSKSIGIDRAGFSGLEEGDAAGGGGGGVAEACAGSVVTRGLMFANRHPAPWGFLPIKAPSSSFSNQAKEINSQSLAESVVHLSMMSRGGGSAVRLIAVEFLPYLRRLAEVPSHAWINRCGATPRRWAYVWNGAVKVVEGARQDQRVGSSGGEIIARFEGVDADDSGLIHDEIEED